MTAVYVSVVISVYNGERFIAEAIESILQQTFCDFELIIIDDGSTDRTVELLRQFQASDKRIVIISPGKVGFVSALNIGVEHAQGKYIARMDADDIALRDRLAKQVDFLERTPEVGICGSAVFFLDGNRERLATFPVYHRQIHSNLLFYCCLAHPSVMLRRDVFLVVRYRSEFGGACDFDLWASAAWAGIRLHNLREPLIKFRMHHQSMTQSTPLRAFCQEIRQWQLAKLGIVPTSAEFEVHTALGEFTIPESLEFLAFVRAWLEKLQKLNQESQVFPDVEFEDVLARHWYYACAANRCFGERVGREFLNSPLGRHDYLSWLKLRIPRGCLAYLKQLRR